MDFSFDTGLTGFNPRNAYSCGLAAQLAYETDGNALRNTLSSWGFADSRVFSDSQTDTQGFIAGNSAMILVAFRGTEPSHLKDWMTDMDIDQDQGPLGKVHCGFYRALCRVWKDIVTYLAELRKTNQSVYITGHSLGGALATLAIAKLHAEQKIDAHSLYTFGQPRVGNMQFANNFNQLFKSKAFRFVNNNDIVPRIPTRIQFYSHVGTLCYFDHNGQLQYDLESWYRMLDRIQGDLDSFLSATLIPDQISDHFMDNYLIRLRALVK
ncbi:MAG TPA: lipase family protein [Desulfuromonadales bacterium]|nr:lipase family protein [Desulfuromonadales bacterium]